MDRMQSTATGMDGLAEMYRAITNNLANADTTGFKRRLIAFQEEGPAAAAAAYVPPSRITAAGQLDLSQGALTQTGRRLDLALDGEGFFVIETAAGPRYTRNGAFRTDASGQLVDAGGQLVGGEGGPIVVPSSVGAERVHVSRDGTVSATGQSIGRLRIVRCEDPTALVPEGTSRFRAPDDADLQPAEGTVVHQGFRENANVNLVEELVNLLTVTRLYEANSKAARMQDRAQKSLLDVAMA